MKLYLDLKKMTFDDNIEHNIINSISNKQPFMYDEMVELLDDNKFIKDTLKIKYKKDKDGKDTDEMEDIYFAIKEPVGWWSFPLYEFKNGEIIDFDYKKYEYFTNTERREILTGKINSIYNPNAELKILRKTMKTILDHLGIIDKDFEKYNDKVSAIINKNPKN